MGLPDCLIWVYCEISHAQTVQAEGLPCKHVNALLGTPPKAPCDGVMK